MHGHDAALHPLEQLQRIIPREKRITRVVVHTEARVLHAFHQLTKHIHLLGKLWVTPKIILVVILDNQGDTAAFRLGQTGLDTLRDQIKPALPRQLWPPLTRKHAAITCAQRRGHADPVFFLLNFLGAKIRIGVREIRRATEHRNHHPALFHRAPRRRPLRRISQLQHAAIILQPVEPEWSRELDPFAQRHRAVFAERPHEGLRKCSEFGHIYFLKN